MMQVGNYNIHFSPSKTSAAKRPGQGEGADYMQNLKDTFAAATAKLEESKSVPGAFIANTFQVNSQQFLNIQDISSQFNAAPPL